MSPALRGQNIARPVGPAQQRTEVRDGEIFVHCTTSTTCTWRTVRPDQPLVIWSAQDAHRMAHLRGWVQ